MLPYSLLNGWEYRLPGPMTFQQTACPCSTPCFLLAMCQNIAKHSRRAGFCVDPIVHMGAERQQKGHPEASSTLIMLGHRSGPMREVLGRTLLCLLMNRDPCILQADGWP